MGAALKTPVSQLNRAEISTKESAAARTAKQSNSGAERLAGDVSRVEHRHDLCAAPVVRRRGSLHRWLTLHAVDYAFGAISLLLCLAFWYLATQYRWHFYVRFADVPGPGAVFHKLIAVNHDDGFIKNVAISLRRIVAGFLIAAAFGLVLGIVIGRYRFANRLMMPVLEVLRPIPAIAWVPIAVMLWPTNEGSIIFITFLGAFFPILLNTVDGVRSVDSVLVRAAQSLGASEFSMLRNVILPGALPNIFLGLALGMGVAWVSLIAAEMISGQFGIGYETWEAYSLVDYPQIVLGMITIGVLGLLCSGSIRLVGNVLMPWLAFSRRGVKG